MKMFIKCPEKVSADAINLYTVEHLWIQEELDKKYYYLRFNSGIQKQISELSYKMIMKEIDK